MADDGDRRRMRKIIDRCRGEYGIEVLEVPGWPERGLTWARVPISIFDHHDASSIKAGEWGSLGVIRDGRPDVSGPLSQFQIARCLDNRPRLAVVAAGRANHAGLGGPRGRIPKDNANAWAYGAECANNGVDEPTTWACHYTHDALFRVVAEVCGFPFSEVIGHREWAPRRKVDPRYDMNWRRQGVANIRPRQEDDMFNDDDRRKHDAIHHESTLTLPNRRGPGGANNGTDHRDTVLGWAAHADGNSYRIEQRLPGIEAQLAATREDLGQVKTMLAELLAAHDPKATG